jgi:hypothetical protein
LLPSNNPMSWKKKKQKTKKKQTRVSRGRQSKIGVEHKVMLPNFLKKRREESLQIFAF